jgi:hypothetical protein
VLVKTTWYNNVISDNERMNRKQLKAQLTGLCGHIDTDAECFGGEQRFDESFGEEYLNNFF